MPQRQAPDAQQAAHMTRWSAPAMPAIMGAVSTAQHAESVTATRASWPCVWGTEAQTQ